MKSLSEYLAQPRSTHAIVMGGSISGLLAARVLSEHVSRVTLIERDRFGTTPEARKGVPQGRHAHALLPGGLQVLERLFPGITATLARQGAPMVDTALEGRWYHFGGYKARFASGFRRPFMTRALLEHEVRRRVRALSNVTIREGCGVEGFVPSEDRSRIVGVWFRANGGTMVESLGADLVVDATGRGSRTPEWLHALGYERPPESEVRVDVRYASRQYRRSPDDVADGSVLYVFPTPPHGRRFGFAMPIEGDRWLVTMGSWHGEAPGTAFGEFEAFASTLEAPDIAALLRRAAPMSEVVAHRFPSNIRRHYERLDRFPRGLVVTGDAQCSFNPIYAQGMSVCAVEAEALSESLLERKGEGSQGWSDLAARFHRRAARVIDVPWMIATGGDFQFPETEGEKRPGTDLVNWYMARLHRRATRDPLVYRAFLRVASLMDPPTSLFRPSILARTLLGGLAPVQERPHLRAPTPAHASRAST